MSSLRETARKIGLASLARIAYRKPMESVRRTIVEGGPIQQALTARGREEMQERSDLLPPLEKRPGTIDRPIYFLTGAKYWFQTVYCIYSLELNSSTSYSPVLIDDGTLTAAHLETASRLVPWITYRTQPEILECLNETIPASRYPTLHEWRTRQPLTRKIIDLHAGQSGWKMLLDSDMLFFREPKWLHNWFENPRPAYMIDCIENYGYSAELRSEICGSDSFPDKANIGFFGWRSEDVDYDWLEYAIQTLFEREGPRYNITQGLTSMLFAGKQCAIAPASDYIVLPTVREGRQPTAVLHHYVAHSKRSYFQHGWREIDRRIHDQWGRKRGD